MDNYALTQEGHRLPKGGGRRKQTGRRNIHMEFSNWKLRKEIMTHDAPDSIRFAMLVVADNIDWNTGHKKFTSKVHYENWLKRLAGIYPLNECADDWEGYHYAIRLMTMLGLATFDTKARELQLCLPDENWDDLASEAVEG